MTGTAHHEDLVGVRRLAGSHDALVERVVHDLGLQEAEGLDALERPQLRAAPPACRECCQAPKLDT